MTEQEWLACTDPAPMLEFLLDNASARKLRLFAGACCRRIWHLIQDSRSQKALQVTERYADGLVGQSQQVNAADQALDAAAADAEGHNGQEADAVAAAAYTPPHVIASAYAAAWARADAISLTGSTPQANYEAATRVAFTLERAVQADLIRDIFGNPLRSVAVDLACLAWNDGAVRKMAQAIYDERAFDRLPLLADALEDAGCTEAEILAHCRGPGPHVRGCWVVDLVLGKK